MSDSPPPPHIIISINNICSISDRPNHLYVGAHGQIFQRGGGGGEVGAPMHGKDNLEMSCIEMTNFAHSMSLLGVGYVYWHRLTNPLPFSFLIVAIIGGGGVTWLLVVPLATPEYGRHALIHVKYIIPIFNESLEFLCNTSLSPASKAIKWEIPLPRYRLTVEISCINMEFVHIICHY